MCLLFSESPVVFALHLTPGFEARSATPLAGPLNVLERNDVLKPMKITVRAMLGLAEEEETESWDVRHAVQISENAVAMVQAMSAVRLAEPATCVAFRDVVVAVRGSAAATDKSAPVSYVGVIDGLYQAASYGVTGNTMLFERAVAEIAGLIRDQKIQKVAAK